MKFMLPIISIVLGYLGVILDGTMFHSDTLLFTWVLFFLPVICCVGALMDKHDKK